MLCVFTNNVLWDIKSIDAKHYQIYAFEIIRYRLLQEIFYITQSMLARGRSILAQEPPGMNFISYTFRKY